MTSFSYPAHPDPVRADLAEAHRRAWRHVAGPGTWLTGAERVAVADETRRARDCGSCRERKQALSPFAVQGEHDHGAALPETLVDLVHRITTDAARLSESWYRQLLEAGLSAEVYVEALGVAVITISVDRFHHALGLPLEPLPEAIAGDPSGERPDDLTEGEAWVPMRESRKLGKEMGFPPGPVPYVIRALSLVPAELRAWKALSDAQYLSFDEMRSFDSNRALDRSQIELVAGRVSALNECFY